MRPRDDQSRTTRGEGGPDALKRRDGARRCVLGGCAQPVGPLCVAVQIGVVGELHPARMRRDPVCVGLHPWPAREAVLRCDHPLCV